MESLISLKGKKILVTGASSGIGRQTAITLSEAGAKVILTARRNEQLRETMGMLTGNGHVYYPFDLCDLDGIEKFLHKVVEENGLMQGLAFCAGISDLRTYNMVSPAIMQRMMTTNFFSFYELVRQFAKKKYSDNGAKIVVISSAASIRPGKGQGAYAASKAAIDASILVLAQELIPRQININCVRPGFVDSPMTQDITEEIKKNILDKQPLGYVPGIDVAIMVAYLLSPAANMITGRGFDIEGGRFCRE